MEALKLSGLIELLYVLRLALFIHVYCLYQPVFVKF